MSEHEVSNKAAAESNEQGDSDPAKATPDAPQEGPGSDVTEPEQTKEVEPSPAEVTEQAQEAPVPDVQEQEQTKEADPSPPEEEAQPQQDEASEPSQDQDHAEPSPSPTGTEDASSTGEGPSPAAEDEKVKEEPASGPKEDENVPEANLEAETEGRVPEKSEDSPKEDDPSPTPPAPVSETGPGTQAEAASAEKAEDSPKEEDPSPTPPAPVSETGPGTQAEAASPEKAEDSPKEDPNATNADPETGTGPSTGAEAEGIPAKAEESSPPAETKAEDSQSPSPDTAEPQTSPSPSPGASAGEKVPEKEEQASQGDGKSENAKAPAASAEVPKAEPAASGDVSPGQKLVLITGANTGIGLVAAEKFARDGYEVIMACRSEEKAQKAVAEVEKKVPGAKVSFMKLDLGSLRSVKEFADAFRSLGKPLNILCNNAGLTTGFSVKERSETEDGFEMTMGVNHLGHFLLTHLLLDILKQTAAQCGEARIVHTASMVHDPDSSGGKRGPPAHLDFDNLMLEKPGTFDGMLAYKNSKLANVVFSIELAKRLEGTNITSNSLCPGFIPSTSFSRNETFGTKVLMVFLVPMLKLFKVTRTLQHGGGMVHHIATDPKYKGVTGKHYSDFKEIPSAKESRDSEVGKKLWDVSADLVKYEQAKAM